MTRQAKKYGRHAYQPRLAGLIGQWRFIVPGRPVAWRAGRSSMARMRFSNAIRQAATRAGLRLPIPSTPDGYTFLATQIYVPTKYYPSLMGVHKAVWSTLHSGLDWYGKRSWGAYLPSERTSGDAYTVVLLSKGVNWQDACPLCEVAYPALEGLE